MYTLTVNKYTCNIRVLLFLCLLMVFNSLFCDDKEAYFILFFSMLILPDLEQKMSKNVIIF